MSISSEKEISVEQAYAVCVCFFVDLWDLIDPILSAQKDQEIHDVHDLFCRIVCLEAMSDVEATSPAAWNEAIIRILKISKEDQKKYKLTLDKILMCMIEFCNIYNHKYGSKLKFLIDMLESMKQNPNKYPEEWNLLKTTFLEVLNGKIRIVDFDWNVNFNIFFQNDN